MKVKSIFKIFRIIIIFSAIIFIINLLDSAETLERLVLIILTIVIYGSYFAEMFQRPEKENDIYTTVLTTKKRILLFIIFLPFIIFPLIFLHWFFSKK